GLNPELAVSGPDAFADRTRTRVPRRTAFAWHGRLFGEPVKPPSSQASHEGLLDPGFIRMLRSGIKAGSDGLDLALNSEEVGQALEDADRGGEGGPAGDRYAVEGPYYKEQDDEPQQTSSSLPPDNRGIWFRRAPPAASPPSSPRGSFSFSVRSGVDKSSDGGWQHEDAPAVPPVPTLYRHTQSGSLGSPPAPVTPSSHTTSFVTITANGTLRPDWTSRRKSAGKETIVSGSGLSTLTAGEASSGAGLLSKHRRADADMRPAVYASTPTSPQSQYAGDRRWSVLQGTGTHARTTSADSLERAVRNRRSRQQLQLLSVTHPDARRSVAGGGSGTGGSEGAGGGISTFEDVVPGNRGSSYVAPARESSCIRGRESSYVINGRDSTYLSSGHHSTYTGTGRGSTYPVAWAEPSSPNETTPALGSPHASSPRIRGMTTMPATPGHSTPGAGPSTLSPLSPYVPGCTAPADPEKAKRLSAISFVLSVVSRFSGHSSHYASAGHQTPNRTFAIAWRGTQQPEEVPPLPTPSPYVARMWEAYNRAGGSGGGAGPSGSNVSATHSTTDSSVVRREGNLELPALAQKAEKLN
ncbi:hypothetical protein FRC07_001735, partial [Ceratobasidium sp. 392]